MLCAFNFQPAQAQTFAEWFSQKKTLIKYLGLQIAALEQYGSYIKQGYQISRSGLGNIGGHLRDEYGLHSAYYSSLSAVNPEIRSNPKADSIIRYAEHIPGQFDHLNGLAGVDDDTRHYIAHVKAKIVAECDLDLSELQMVITSGQAQMTDDERISRIDHIYTGMKDKCAFTQSFCNNVRMLVVQRSQDLQDATSSGRYYEIN